MIDVLVYGSLLASMAFLAVSLGFNWEHCSKGLRCLCIAILLSGTFLLCCKLVLLC